MHFHEEDKNPQKEHELKSQQSAIKNSELNQQRTVEKKPFYSFPILNITNKQENLLLDEFPYFWDYGIRNISNYPSICYDLGCQTFPVKTIPQTLFAFFTVLILNLGHSTKSHCTCINIKLQNTGHLLTYIKNYRTIFCKNRNTLTLYFFSQTNFPWNSALQWRYEQEFQNVTDAQTCDS